MTRAAFSLGLVGAAHSGKSTLAKAAVERYGMVRLGFGDYMRAIAEQRDAATDRSTLQAIGASELKRLGPQGLCRAVLEHAGLPPDVTGLVWDGIRHAEILETLRAQHAPSPLVVIGVAPPDDERRQRLAAEATNPSEIEDWERDSTERQVPDLLAHADLIIRAPTPVAAIADLVAWLDDRFAVAADYRG